MNVLQNHISTESLHHAYILVGDRSRIFSDLEDFLATTHSVVRVGNPDFWHSDFESFSVGDARKLVLAQQNMSLGDSKKIFIIKTNFITEEAQNALLKVFEEPTENTHMFVITPQNTFLPTLRSRVEYVVVDTREIKEKKKSVLDMNIVERLTYVKKLTDDIGDEKKTKQDALEFLNTLEQELYESGGVEKYSRLLNVCQSARSALLDRGAMTKMILENVVLNM
jgi:DNA polymerase III gamma/tau subunit